MSPDDVIDDVDVLGESGPVYSKRDLYERGHVAVCSHRQVFLIFYNFNFKLRTKLLLGGPLLIYFPKLDYIVYSRC